MRKSRLHGIVNDFVSLFYPNYCIGCSDILVKGEEYICTRCMLDMPQTSFHLEPDNVLSRRMSGRLQLSSVLAMFKFSKSGRIQKVLHTLKYKNEPEVGVILGRVYAQKLKDSGNNYNFDLIVPVPLHASRLRKRGYNQSAKFAEGLSSVLDIPVQEKILLRRRRTETQTRKTKLKRWENVNDVFSFNSQASVAGKSILLVDDVITTGATVEACGKTLLDNGCGSLSIACIAAA